MSTKCASATAARRARYDEAVKAALPHIRGARAASAKNAKKIAEFLNAEAVPGPTNEHWTVDAVLRCLRRLKALGLDKGSLTPHQARTWRTYRPRRIQLGFAEKFLKKVPQQVLDEIEQEQSAQLRGHNLSRLK